MIWNNIPLSIILALTNSTLLTGDLVLSCTKDLYLIHDSHSPLCRRICTLLLVQCHHSPIWPALPLNVTYIGTVLLKLSVGSPPYANFLTFHVPNVMSVFCRVGNLSSESVPVFCHVGVGNLSSESVQVWGSLNCFVTTLIFMVRG
jgi:hypothetical protein